MLATECPLLIARACRKPKILWGGDCRVTLQFEASFFWCVLAADVDAELGLIACVWSRIGQMARLSTPERSVAHNLGMQRTQNTQEWHDFRETHRIAQTSWANARAWDEKWHEKRNMCACVRWGVIWTSPSRSRQLPMSGRETWKKNMADECAKL